MTPIFNFLTENVDLPDLDYAKVEKWLSEVAHRHGYMVRELTYIFCDDKRILEVNLEFLNHDYFTDIITFSSSHGKLLTGDMYISLETVASNSELVGDTYTRELLRVIVHGLLHLCGINDKGPGEREIMEMHENEALTIYKSIE